MPILWLKKEHKYSKETDHYCYLRWRKAKSRKAQLFWINAHYLCGELNIQLGRQNNGQ